ncbi:class I SAM-dependent methyltransferase [Streptomyces sp. G-G2]|uniref:class I SAM-dependent methyltransferase n=1 Tax=Streptomyces sp. G-G2 TaxID=3046201 RepID=UPI0024BAFA15|nr:class I SAM-dependent methyltransferase [Streptomyces sp. G-G2]MDJ0382410.1 class I SAM-dependent methyltransferase [Streptomyces sp. G-G2]
MIATLPRVLPSPDGKPVPPQATAEAFRSFARDLAAGHRPWTVEAARFLSTQFDQMAADWDTTQATGRDDPLRDALSRSGPLPHGLCLELGSGTGQFTELLASAYPAVVSMDISQEMLRQAAGRSPWRVRADASTLPTADGSVAAIVAIDMLLFPAETSRVLASDGVLLWINQLGEDGPLYLPAEDVASALPGHWTAIEAEAGWGTWAALRRATDDSGPVLGTQSHRPLPVAVAASEG